MPSKAPDYDLDHAPRSRDFLSPANRFFSVREGFLPFAVNADYIAGHHESTLGQKRGLIPHVGLSHYQAEAGALAIVAFAFRATALTDVATQV
jgi:hypothetical protein